MTEFTDTTPFEPPFSQLDNPRLEFAMEVRLTFPEVYTMAPHPFGGMRSAVLVEGGTFEGPNLKGRAIPGSGGDYAYFRPDDVAVFDARYLLEEEDGTIILLHNKGYLWGRKPDTMQRLRDWAFAAGPPVPHAEYYLTRQSDVRVRDRQTRLADQHVFVGVGERRSDGNRLRYYALV